MRPSRQVRDLAIEIALLGIIVIAAFFLNRSMADSANTPVFGPETFIREQGRPQTSVRQFEVADASMGFNLELINGHPDDNEDFRTGKKNRVNSAQVFLNDIQVVGPADISRDMRQVTVPVSLREGRNTLKVTLTSNPVSMLSVTVYRTDSTPAPDLTPPQVIALEPPPGAIGVPVAGSIIRATFSEPIRLDTLDGTSFYLTADGQNVSGSLEPSADSTSVIFKPSAPISFQTVYTLTVTEAIRDLAGNPLASRFSSSFTTEAAPPPPPPAPDTTSPRVIAISPAAGSQDNQNSVPVNITFSEPIAAETIRDNLLVFADTAQGSGTVVIQDGGSFIVVPNGERVEGTTDLSADGLRAVFIPSSATPEGMMRPDRLPASAEITVVVTTRVKDLAGNGLDQNAQASGLQWFTANFTTSAFNLTGSTSFSRVNPQAALLHAALLPGDEVIVSGGYNEFDQVNLTAEIYNAAEGKFRSVPMIEGRAEHSVTILGSGLVLIAGGIGADGQVLASAEIYDPRTEAFHSAGSMNTPRFGHTATLLPDGTVLVAGGYNSASLDTAEIFIPEGHTLPFANSFLDVPARMRSARAYHTATSLRDGAVLIAGGLSNGSVLDTAEIFVPVPFAPNLGQFISGANALSLWRMSSPRFRHTSTLLSDGRILIAGGKDNLGRAHRTAEMFKPSALLALSSFESAGYMTEARSNHTATLLSDGSVLIAGGSSGSLSASSTAEIYRNGQFIRVRSPLSDARQSHAGLLLSNGTALLSNGHNGTGRLRSAETYTLR